MSRGSKVIQWYRGLSEGTKIFWAIVLMFSITLPKYFSDKKYSKKCKRKYSVIRLDNIYHRLKDNGLNGDLSRIIKGKIDTEERIALESYFSDYYGGLPSQEGYYIISYCWDRYTLNALYTELKLNDVDDSWLDSTWNSLEDVKESCKNKIKQQPIEIIRTK